MIRAAKRCKHVGEKLAKRCTAGYAIGSSSYS